MQKIIWVLLLIFTQQSYCVKSITRFTSVDLSFLYWTLSEVGTDNWAQLITPANANQTIQLLDLNFAWRPGLRIGFLHQNEHNHWDNRIAYTWYQTNGNSQATTNVNEIHPAFSGNFYANNTQGNGLSGPYYHDASINWNFLLNNITWQLGYNLIHDDYKLHPYTGLQNSFLHQNINTYWLHPYENTTKTPLTTFSAASEVIQNNFWGVGPLFGMDLEWSLIKEATHTINLFGDFSGAFLWGNWNISDIYSNDTPVRITTENNVRSSTIPMTRLLLGLDWQIDDQNINLLFKIGYEAQAWINQLKFYSFDGGRQNGTLYTQGGVFNVCAYF
jgi:hypothetical protein